MDRWAGKAWPAWVSPWTVPRHGWPSATARTMAVPTRRESGHTCHRVSQQRLTGRVQGHEPTLEVGGHDAVLDALHHRGKQSLAPAERVLHGVEGFDERLGLALRDREPILDDVAGGGPAQGGGQDAFEPDPCLEQVGQREVARCLAVEQLAHD